MLEYKIRQFKRQFQEARYRLYRMCEKFAEPLYDMNFVATKDVWRISTNGYCIYFNPEWTQKLAPTELDFILSHILMHIELGHIERPNYYLGDRYHLAADIVANAKLTNLGWEYEKLPHIGRIRVETFFPTVSGMSITSVEAIKYVPIDPSVMKPTQRRQFMLDSEEWWDRKDDRGEHGTIVLSPADEDPDDLEYDGPTYGGSYRFKKEKFPPSPGNGQDSDEKGGKFESKQVMASPKQGITNALNILRQEVTQPRYSSNAGEMTRIWYATKARKLNWKQILDAFIQEEVNDYSFMPPDKRFQDGDFFLPDYNVKYEVVREVYFFVDASGSISDDMLAVAYEEICQALNQFDGALSGMLAFFDTRVYHPVAFQSVADVKKLRPVGGGGTDYSCIFEFIKQTRDFNQPTSIVIITDGDGYYPDATGANGIPVLWLMTGERKAPWGRSIRVN